MGKIVKALAIGGAMIGASFLTGGASLAASGGLLGVGLTTTALGSSLLLAGADTILSGLTSGLKAPAASAAQVSRLDLSFYPDAPRKIVFGGDTAAAVDMPE